MIETHKTITGTYDRDVTINLFNLRIDSKARGQWYTIFKERPRLEVRKHSFLSSVTDPRSSLPNQVTEASMVEAFERRLDRH